MTDNPPVPESPLDINHLRQIIPIAFQGIDVRWVQPDQGQNSLKQAATKTVTILRDRGILEKTMANFRSFDSILREFIAYKYQQIGITPTIDPVNRRIDHLTHMFAVLFIEATANQ